MTTEDPTLPERPALPDTVNRKNIDAALFDQMTAQQQVDALVNMFDRMVLINNTNLIELARERAVFTFERYLDTRYSYISLCRESMQSKGSTGTPPGDVTKGL